jgi:hypothetical protein
MTLPQPLDQLLLPLRRHLREALTRFERIQYDLRGRISDPEGDVQLTFGSGTIHLAGGPDGSSLLVNDVPWTDPFAGPLDEETQAFLERSGRWVLVDTSTTQPNARAIGRELTGFYAVLDETSRCCGVQLWFEPEVFSVIVEGDEVDLIWGKALPSGHRLLWTVTP